MDLGPLNIVTYLTAYTKYPTSNSSYYSKLQNGRESRKSFISAPAYDKYPNWNEVLLNSTKLQHQLLLQRESDPDLTSLGSGAWAMWRRAVATWRQVT